MVVSAESIPIGLDLKNNIIMLGPISYMFISSETIMAFLSRESLGEIEVEKKRKYIYILI